MSLLYQKHASRPLTLDNRVEPELYRDVFPYTHVSRIEFDDIPRPPPGRSHVHHRHNLP